MTYQENQIFVGAYPPEAAEWCNEGGLYHIEEIEPDGDARRFQIVANEEHVFTVEEQISILQAKLTATDYVVIKIAEGAAARDEYADVIEQRRQWREEINQLENREGEDN